MNYLISVLKVIFGANDSADHCFFDPKLWIPKRFATGNCYAPLDLQGLDESVRRP